MSSRDGLPATGRATSVALGIALASQCGCGLAQSAAKSAAKGAAQGAVGTLAGKVGDRENVLRLTDEITRRVAGGMMNDLSEPRRLEELRRIAATVASGSVQGASRAAQGTAPVDAMAEQAARAFSRQIVAELGHAGDGPLAESLSATTEQVTESIARGARGELAPLFPECQGAGASQCLDRAVERLSRATTAGVAEGIRGSLGGWPLVLAFGAGALVAVAIGWAWGVYRARRSAPAA